jgi:hypothetical protein
VRSTQFDVYEFDETAGNANTKSKRTNQ